MASARGLFVTGTDTNVGKTVVTVALLRALVANGYRAIGMKPVAAGLPPGTDVSADVTALAAASGGALVPLGDRVDMLDIPVTLALPVVLVVGIRLGCLNHALLTSLAIRERGLHLVGWVANRIDAAMEQADANVADLERRLCAPLLADIPQWARRITCDHCVGQTGDKASARGGIECERRHSFLDSREDKIQRRNDLGALGGEISDFFTETFSGDAREFRSEHDELLAINHKYRIKARYGFTSGDVRPVERDNYSGEQRLQKIRLNIQKARNSRACGWINVPVDVELGH